MDAPYILHMLSPLRHVSPFDINMALDAGFQAVIPYTGVEPGDVRGLVQDAIFSRGPKGAKRTSMFIGGKNAIQALDMLEAARKSMVPPFAISVFADPAGSFTTAAAMVAKVEKVMRDRHGVGLAGRSVAVFGGTGVVGFAAGVIAASQGARAVLIGYDGTERVKQLAATAKERFKIELGHADGGTDGMQSAALKSADIALCAGRAGVRILSARQIAGAGGLKIAADVNAVPPAGIEDLGVQDDGAPIAGTNCLGIGPLAIGGIKYKVEAGLFKKMIETDKPLYLDFRDAFNLARELVG